MLTKWDAARGFDAMLWVLERSPIPLNDSPTALANTAIHSLFGISLTALVLLVFAVGMLSAGRLRLRPAEQSDDGTSEIVLEPGERRVGRPLAGYLKLSRKAQPGAAFLIRVTCVRRYRTGNDSRERRTEVAFSTEQHSRPLPSPQGLKLPFRFEIPAHAPPSATGFAAHEGYQWSVELLPGTGRRSANFALTLAAAPESEIQALEAAEAPDVRGKIDAIDEDLRAIGHGKLRPHQRAELRNLSPEQLARAVDMVERTKGFLTGFLGASIKRVLGCLGFAVLLGLLLSGLAMYLSR